MLTARLGKFVLYFICVCHNVVCLLYLVKYKEIASDV